MVAAAGLGIGRLAVLASAALIAVALGARASAGFASAAKSPEAVASGKIVFSWSSRGLI